MGWMLLFTLLASIASVWSAVLPDDGNNSYRIVPFCTARNGVEIPITNDMHLELVLTILDLPQGSADLISIYGAKSVNQLLNLPRSVYGSEEFWKDLQNTNIPPIIVLQLLDNYRYGGFEANVFPNVPEWIVAIKHKHLSTIVPDYDIFPNYRLLRTFKTHFRDSMIPSEEPLFAFTYITVSSLIDWSLVFFRKRVECLADEQIKIDRELRKAVVKDMTRRFVSKSKYVSDYFIGLLECFIFKHGTFYERFEDCISELDIPKPPDYDDEVCRFHTAIAIRRNELLFKQAFGKKMAVGYEHAFVDSILKLYFAQVCLTLVHAHLQDKLVQYKEFITPALWRILGTELQTRSEHHVYDFKLVLICYFLGHVDLLPPFIERHPELEVLPMRQERDLHINFDINHFGPLGSERLSKAIDLATFFNPEIKIGSSDLAFKLITCPKFICSLSALSYMLANCEPIPEHEADFATVFESTNYSEQEPFKKRIYLNLCLIPRNNLVSLVKEMGFEVLKFLDDGTCIWFLENILEHSVVHGFSSDLLHNLERLFPSIAVGKDVEWSIELLKMNAFRNKWISRRLVLMVIKHFDLAAGLFNVLLRFVLEHTEGFVQLFKKIWEKHETFDCDLEATCLLGRIRPGLSQWLHVRFDIVPNKQGGCRLSRKLVK